MAFKGPFQQKLFCDSMSLIIAKVKSTLEAYKNFFSFYHIH